MRIGSPRAWFCLPDFQKRDTVLPPGLVGLCMAASSRNIERGEWKGREENEIQCDADVDLPRESPTPNWHCTRQSHHANGICNRGVKSTNDNRASEHLVPFVNSSYNFGTYSS